MKRTEFNTILGYTDGLAILGDVYLSLNSRHYVIFCHGFKGFKDWGSYPAMARCYREAGHNVIAFNFSHNGGTVEQPIDFPDLTAFSRNTFSKELSDIRSVVDYACKAGAEKIALIGHSRGGAISTLYAASDDRIRALITWSAVADLISWLERLDIEQWKKEGLITVYNGRTHQDMPLKVDLLEEVLLEPHRFDVLKAASNLTIPVLIVHAMDDSVISHEDALAFHRTIEHSTLHILPEGGHTFGVKHPAESDSLPEPLNQAINVTLSFLKSEVGFGNSVHP